MIALETRLGALAVGDRFTVTQYPEGTLTGTVDGPADADGLIDVDLDGQDELSCWPQDTQVTRVSS